MKIAKKQEFSKRKRSKSELGPGQSSLRQRASISKRSTYTTKVKDKPKCGLFLDVGMMLEDSTSTRSGCGNHGISHLNFIGCGLLSVLRSRPSFQNWPGNQVESSSANRSLQRPRAFGSKKLSVGHLYKSPISSPSFLSYVILDFSSVSTEAGHEPMKVPVYV